MGANGSKPLGVSLKNVNGLLNMAAWARSLGGDLVPHGNLPDEFGASDRPKIVLIDQNGLLRLRHDVAVQVDSHVVCDIRGQWRHVRRDGQSIFEEDQATPFYICTDNSEGQWPAGVYETDTRPWWCELEAPDRTPGYWLSERWKMVRCWLSRAAPVLEASISGLPDEQVLFRAKFEGELGDHEDRGGADRLSYDETKSQIRCEVDSDNKTVLLTFGARFEDAIFHPENIAERALVERLVEGFFQLAGTPLGEGDCTKLVEAIVPDAYARQTHVFRARRFWDFVGFSVPQLSIGISNDDVATVKLGLEWRVRKREQGGDILGKPECTAFLNSVVELLVDDLCEDCRQFDRKAVLAFALRNHESAINDRDRWERTAAAVLSLHTDKQATREKIAERNFELSAVFQATRLLVEFAICECPLTGGRNPGRLDSSRLMAQVSLLAGLGNWSDAIFGM